MVKSKEQTPRNLEFKQLSDVVQEVNELSGRGYWQLGNWDLGQTCCHLEDWLRFPVEGFPKIKFPVSFVLWIIRTTVGKSSFRKIIHQKGMKNNSPTLAQTVKSAGTMTEFEAIARLESAIGQFAQHQGQYFPSPIFGALTRDEATQIQLIHCAHHLSFLIPKCSGDPG